MFQTYNICRFGTEVKKFYDCVAVQCQIHLNWLLNLFLSQMVLLSIIKIKQAKWIDLWSLKFVQDLISAYSFYDSTWVRQNISTYLDVLDLVTYVSI